MTKLKPLHFNVPQLQFQLVKPSKSYNIWGRGTGKTSGILAPMGIENIRAMPRGQHGIIGATYQQLLVRTLPPMVKMWHMMGFKEGVHYIIGKEPPEKWKKMWRWSPPRTKPLDSQYAIYWFNGAVNILISQDRSGSSNGLSLATLMGDEAKLLNKERLDDETIPALRGDRSYFGHLPSYRSEHYTTDMPTTADAKWILDMAEQMDTTQIELITQLQLKVNLYRKQLLSTPGRGRKALIQKIDKLEKELLRLRLPRKVGNDYRYCVYYSEVSALENLDVLGPEYLSDMRRTLSDIKYRTSILNEKLMKVEEGFYGNLEPSHHGQNWYNYHYIDQFAADIHNTKLHEQDCRHDAGFISSKPLDVAFDYGDRINCMVVGQEVKDEYRLLNSFYVLHPQLVDAVVEKFCHYFRHYKTKVVNYYYDHTAIPSSGVTDFNYYQRVVDCFRKNGWKVYEHYIGQAPRHETKYEFINMMLRESNSRLPKFRYSKDNCSSWEMSALNTPIKQSDRGFKKDKSAERNPKVKPEEAPHLSDAADTLLFGKFQEEANADNGSFIPMA